VIVAFFVAVYCVKVPNTILPTIDELVQSEDVVVTAEDVEKNRNRLKIKKSKTKETNLRKKKTE
jgi:hypothetical protein